MAATVKKNPELINELTKINFGRAYSDNVAAIKKDRKQLEFYTNMQKISILQTIIFCLRFDSGITKQDFPAINSFLSGANNGHSVSIASPGESNGIKIADLIAIPIKETSQEMTALFFSLKDKKKPIH